MRRWPSQQHHAVLCVSKQILSESRESFDQRALICASESDLVSKVFNSSPVILNKIQTLVITFEDGCYAEEMGSLLESVTEEPPCGADKAYFRDLQSVVVCLSRLPNTTELAFLQSKDFSSDRMLKDFFASLLPVGSPTTTARSRV